jgi:ubiquinone/menaquinone biosynthesis C-methylase UbiE/uncharacterized protein YbaR (Trm112 family)
VGNPVGDPTSVTGLMKVTYSERIEPTTGHSPDVWLLGIVGCPSCKAALIPTGGALHCHSCNLDYAIEAGIPVMLSPDLKEALEAGRSRVKHFYYEEERYDWTRDPQGLELAYHRYRKWETWRQVTRMLQEGAVALDVGCGTGLITYEFRRRSHRVVAVDLNRWALSRMDGKPYIVKIQGDGESLPIQDESVDLVVATEMIEHLEAPEKTAGEIFRVCKRGGRVVGSVPSTSIVWKWRKYLSMTCGGGEPFHRNFNKNEITSLWHDAGFKVKVTRGCLGLNWIWVLEKP